MIPSKRIAPSDVTHYIDRNGRRIKRRWPKVTNENHPNRYRPQLVQPEVGIEIRTEEFTVRFLPTTFDTVSASVRADIVEMYQQDLAIKDKSFLNLRYVGEECLEVPASGVVRIPTGLAVDLKQPNRIGMVTTHPFAQNQGFVICGGVTHFESTEHTEIELLMHNVGFEQTVYIQPGDLVARYLLQHRIGMDVTLLNALT